MPSRLAKPAPEIYVHPNAIQMAVEEVMTDLAVRVYWACEVMSALRPADIEKMWEVVVGALRNANRLSLFEQIPDAQLKAGEDVVSADDVLGAQDDSWYTCLAHRELTSKRIDDPDLFNAGIEIDSRLAVDLWSGIAWRYHLDREIWSHSNIRAGAFGQPPLPNEGEIWAEYRIGILLEYETGIVREEPSELIRQNEHSKIGAQFSRHFTMDSTGRVHLDQFSFDENIGRVRAELVQIFGGEESGRDHWMVLCLMADGSWGEVRQS
jgi:hypothetical protein